MKGPIQIGRRCPFENVRQKSGFSIDRKLENSSGSDDVKSLTTAVAMGLTRAIATVLMTIVGGGNLNGATVAIATKIDGLCVCNNANHLDKD